MEKITKLSEKNESLEHSLLKFENKLIELKKKQDSDRQKIWYYKNKLAKNCGTEKMKDLNEEILFLQNMSEELKEKVNEFESEMVSVFEGGKYNDNIRTLYYDLLSKNVSVENIECVIGTVLERLAGKSCERLPKKSLAATMLAEMNLISKAQVGEAMLNSSNNVLHLDGTKYNFNEVGSFQISTSSGSYTMGIEDMFSGEAQSYFNEIEGIFTAMADLISPDDSEHEQQKLLVSIKAMMTDRTVLNSTFQKKFENWRKSVLPFVVENYNGIPDIEKEKITTVHHVFCVLHVVHNLGIYAEKHF